MRRHQPPPNANTPARATGRDERWRVAGLCVGLAVITFAVFGQTLRHGFVDYDDNEYVYDNAVVARGLTPKGIIWAFTRVNAYEWYPLTTVSHMLDCQIYGLQPGGHHLTNVLLHTATVIALFLVLRQMTGALWRSAFVAAVFAIHPLRAESVAWVTERKDVLSGFFFMLTLWAYVRYAEAESLKSKVQSLKSEAPVPAARTTHHTPRFTLLAPRSYVFTLFLFALGLLSKTMLVTLPLVLLLLDYWPLGRSAEWRMRNAKSGEGQGELQPTGWGRLWLEKLPLLALSAAAGVATLLAQHGVMQSTEAFSLPLRLANALVSGLVYLGQMVWPAGLAVYYPYPRHGFPWWEAALAGTLLTGLAVAAWGQRRKRPWLLVGWLWYWVMLPPAAGVIQVSRQAHADRYTYLPQIGIYVAVTWLVAEWGAKRRAGRRVLAGLATAVLAALMICARQQTAYWKDSETLWTRQLARTPDNEAAHNSLGAALYQKGRVDEAIVHFQAAVQSRPDYAEAHNNLGNALLQKGRAGEAMNQFQLALQIRPQYAEARINLGNALCQVGKVEEAIAQYQKALQLNSGCAEAYSGLGTALLQKGRTDDAIAQYQNALQIKPRDPEPHYNLGNALLQKGRMDEAIAQYQSALQINPGYGGAHLNLGNVLLQKGRVDEAISHYQSALQISPDSADAQGNLGTALLQKGRVTEAIAQYQNALRIAPTDPKAQSNLAWVLATCPDASLRDGGKAVALARQANELTGGKNPGILHTLAAAFAEAGQFDDAQRTVQKALGLAQAAGQPDLAARLNDELKRYQAGLPLHQ
jgi:tetratricopeptide (TPR) repeat protein